MRNLFAALFPYARRYLPAIAALAMPFVVGCIAAAGEQATKAAAVQLTWETLLTVHSPMAVWLVWFLRRDEQRRNEDAERRKEDALHRKEWTALIVSNTEALTNVAATLTLARADDEKNRLATYKLAEEIKEVCVKVDAICSGLLNSGFSIRNKT